MSFDDMPEMLVRADAIVCTTASPHPILDDDAVSAVMEKRDGRPLLLVDLAVPRDVAPEVRDVPGVALYDIDDLQAVVRRNRSVRQVEAQHAEGIVEDEIQRFAEWLGSLEVLPTVAALRARGQAIAEQIVRENAGRWESASERDLERVGMLAQAVVNRILHEPTLRMKNVTDERVHLRMQVIRDLFGLEDAPEGIEGEEQLAEVRALPRRNPTV
jgi:glutamyl-tRNA reductase